METAKGIFLIRDDYTIEYQLKERSFFISLTQVSKDELYNLKEEGEPGVVYKKGQNLFYANLSSFPFQVVRLTLANTRSHACAICRHLSALPDEQGGCSKVRAFSRNIENFDYILEGYETFNTPSDVFIVCKCLNWEREHYVPKKYTLSEKNKHVIFLAQHLGEWVETLADVQALEASYR